MNYSEESWHKRLFNFLRRLCGGVSDQDEPQIPPEFFLSWQTLDMAFHRHRLGKSPDSLFDLTFEMIGKLIYMDRKAIPIELDIVELYMHEFLRLSIKEKSNAFRAMAKGRTAARTLEELGERFHKRYGSFKRSQALLDILIATAASDGPLDERERAVLEKLARICNIRHRVFERLVMRQAKRDRAASEFTKRHGPQAFWSGYESRRTAQWSGGQAQAPREPQDEYAAAYARLGCTPSDPMQKVKAAYHKLVMTYHPDRATITGQPEETVKYYTDRFREVQEAYELIEQRVRLRGG